MTESEDAARDRPLPRRSPRPGDSEIGRARSRLYGDSDTALAADGRWVGVAARERSAALARAVVTRAALPPPRAAPDDEAHDRADAEPAAGPVEAEALDEPTPLDEPAPPPSGTRRVRVGVRRAAVLVIVLAIGVVAGLLLGRSSDPPAAASPLPALPTMIGRVEGVRDGQTITVRVGDRPVDVVIVGLDTPDPASPGTPTQCGAGSATAYATDTLAGQVVTLVPDPSLGEVDAQGRRLAHVVLRTQQSYTDLALNEGIGRRSTTPVTWYDAVFAQEEAAARNAGAGIWGAPCRATP